MEKVKARRVKPKLGDVFYVPIDDNAEYLKVSETVDGKYVPKSDDKVGLGQIVWLPSNDSMMIVIYDLIVTQEKAITLSLENVIKSKIIYILRMNTSAIKRNWWPILGNKPVLENTPFQAYLWDEVTGTVWDYTGDKEKTISSNQASKLIRAGIFYNGGYVVDAIRYHSGIPFPTEWYEIDPMIPRKEGLVWKIFPELYQTPEDEPNI